MTDSLRQSKYYSAQIRICQVRIAYAQIAA